MGRSASAGAQPILDRWPLVGRTAELAFGRDRIAAGGSVVIAGDAGVGKTRLARELIALATTGGRRTAWAVATLAARPLPFGALAHVVPADAVGGGRQATLRAVVDGLSQGEGPLVLGVDDAHLLDGASAAAVHQLISQGAASVVLTARSGQPVPDAVLGLWKDDLAVRMDLQPLARAEVAELLVEALGGPVDGATMRGLWELSQGNVLFLRQLVLHGLESGSLRAGALWHWRGRLGPGQRLREVVEARLGNLDDSERDALEVLAIGEPVPLRCLLGLVPPEVVTRLERRALVLSDREAPDVQLRLAHPLFGEVLRVGAPASRSDEVRRRLADAFHVHGSPGPDATLRMATWRAEIGDRSDPRLLVEGARRAWALGDTALVERLTRLALEAGPDFEASYLLGKALVGEGRSEDAVRTWQAALGRSTTDAERGALAAGLAHLLLLGLGRPGDADATVRRAAQSMEDGVDRQELEAVRALMRAVAAETAGERMEYATAVLGDPGLPSRIRASATLAAVTALTELGHFQRAVEAATDAIAVADAGTGGTRATMLRTCLGDSLWPAGRLADAEALAMDGYAAALEHADHRRGIWCRLLGSVALVSGDARRALVWLEEAELVLREQSDDGFLRGVLVRLSMAAALLGDVELAARALHGTDRSKALFARGWDLELTRAQAWLCMARGERSAAVRHARAGARAAADRGHRTVEAFALHDLVRFGEARGAVGRLRDLALEVDGPLVSGMAAHAQALVSSDGSALDAVAADFASLGCHLYAAEAAAAAVATHRAAGRRSGAAASARRVQDWMARCDGVRTPALAEADHDDHLTAREREVATLAASGLGDQQIAERLFISVRTVHSHLHATYTKLDVSGRSQLGAVLGTGE